MINIVLTMSKADNLSGKTTAGRTSFIVKTTCIQGHNFKMHFQERQILYECWMTDTKEDEHVAVVKKMAVVFFR
uniref:4HBT domain-containing protein n=1 Tax=Steinernema glaseri TaxID=37863 RepID=A0A1I7ZQU1_9BILA